MTVRPRIVFVHEGKAAYPEIAAYRAFFETNFDVAEATPASMANLAFDAPTVLWHMMGFYPRDLSAGRALAIHDYRSLSVGRGSRAKDLLKRWLNAKPNLRVFQNEAMREAMGFADGVPSLLLPMGVPSMERPENPEKKIDFVYAGAMSAERQTGAMIESFWRRFGATKSFVLYGKPEESVVRLFADRPSIVFAGPLPQAALFDRLVEARCAVNYFPNHFPHLVQTPTKFLEYAALGARVLANEHPASRAAASAYGLRAFWGPAHDMFRTVPDALNWPDNAGVDPGPFLWPSVIEASGVCAALNDLVGKA